MNSSCEWYDRKLERERQVRVRSAENSRIQFRAPSDWGTKTVGSGTTETEYRERGENCEGKQERHGL